MPVPTEQLADAIRELAHRLDSQERAFREMNDQFFKFREIILVFRMRVNTILAIASTVVLLSAGAIAVGILTYQYERGRIEAVIANQTSSMERLEKRFDELRTLGDRLDRLSEANARLQGRLDREGAPVSKK